MLQKSGMLYVNLQIMKRINLNVRIVHHVSTIEFMLRAVQ